MHRLLHQKLTCRSPLARTLRLESLEERRLLSVDFGDAPDPYPTTLADDGARHEAIGPGEQIFDRVSVGGGDNGLRFDVPSWAVSGNTYARFRLSTAGDLGMGGLAVDGEVEDYQLTINPPAPGSGLFRQKVINIPDTDHDHRNAINGNADRAQSVFAADVDGDGDLDVLSASEYDDKIAWYENDGSGSFTTHTISTDADSALSVFAADLDGDGDIDVLSASATDDKIAWYENFSRSPEPIADLTGNGFVDFEDLTVLLAAWNQNVSAAEGNLVDAAGTPVNFEDLTVLLAAWTGPGGAASPQAAVVAEDVGRDDRAGGRRDAGVETSSAAENHQRRGKPAASARAHNPLRRLQAAAVDRAISEQSESTLPRRISAFIRRRR